MCSWGHLSHPSHLVIPGHCVCDTPKLHWTLTLNQPQYLEAQDWTWSKHKQTLSRVRLCGCVLHNLQAAEMTLVPMCCFPDVLSFPLLPTSSYHRLSALAEAAPWASGWSAVLWNMNLTAFSGWGNLKPKQPQWQALVWT